MSTVRDSRQILSDAPPPVADERRVYGPEPLQFGDLRMPDGEGPHPLVIILHGGAWKSTFNLIHTGHMAIALTDLGYATFNVEYRRVGDPGGGWPGSFGDVLLAVDHALEIPGVDRDRVVVAGHSAGGHLALLAASERNLPVVAMAAGSDIEAWKSEASFAFVDDGSRGEANPRARIPLRARQVFIHGTDDDQVPYWLAPAFVEAAREAGDEAHLVTLDGAGHFDMIDPHSPHWPQLVEAIRLAVGR
jgi:acetyl esterase/lipase